jgi:tight adherence protein C
MLTLMISSGIAPLRAIEIISERCESNLSFELGILIDQVKRGESSSQALDLFAKRIDTLDSRRFSNAISMALERGSPLIPVLTSLVSDVRNEEKFRLLKRAGKAEIALMVPVVFLLLPISVVFALYPSFTNMQMF